MELKITRGNYFLSVYRHVKLTKPLTAVFKDYLLPFLDLLLHFTQTTAIPFKITKDSITGRKRKRRRKKKTVVNIAAGDPLLAEDLLYIDLKRTSIFFFHF